MNQKNRVMLSAVSEAVLVVAGELELDGYGHWEELIDWISTLHEELNDMKPSMATTEE